MPDPTRPRRNAIARRAKVNRTDSGIGAAAGAAAGAEGGAR